MARIDTERFEAAKVQVIGGGRIPAANGFLSP